MPSVFILLYAPPLPIAHKLSDFVTCPACRAIWPLGPDTAAPISCRALKKTFVSYLCLQFPYAQPGL